MRLKKITSLFLVLLLSLGALSACTNGTTPANSDNGNNGNTVKAKIDNLYVGGLDRNKELICVSSGKSYITTGGKAENAEGILTDGKNAGSEKTDSGWAVFDYSSGIEITVDLGGTVEGISSFDLDMLQLINDAIFTADEIKVSASTDGNEFTDVGIMLRVTQDTETTGTDKKENPAKPYSLSLPGAIKASKIRFALKSSKKGSAYIDEINIYKYGDKTAESDNKTEYKQFYNGKLPEKVTQPVYWDAGESDYNTKQNLVLKRTPSVFNFNIDLSADSNSPVEDIVKLTDGVRLESASFSDPCLFKANSPNANSDARLFIFDLEKTSAITGFRTAFVKNKAVGVDIPESYSVYASENGVAWDVVYRRDGIRLSDTSSNSIVTVESEFEKAHKARFVAVFFDIEGNTYFDEIEIFGTKSIAGAVPVSEKGDTKLFAGVYPQPEDAGGIHDMLLMYHCYSNTINGTTPVTGGLNEDQCLSWVAYLDKDQKINDFYFDTFHFVPGGGTENFISENMWKVYMDNLFSKDFNLDALNKAAGKAKAALGKNDYKVKVVLSVFVPSKAFKNFGDLDGDGKNEDFTKSEDQKKAIDWQLNQYISRFNAQKYENLTLTGFYWLAEEVYYSDINIPSTIRYTSDSAHKLGYIMTACPYYLASGFYDWYNLGVDVAWRQPSYYFWNFKPQTIAKTAYMAKQTGMGIEMEVEGNALTDANYLKRYIAYLKGGVDYGYMKASHMYYYSLPYYQSCISKSILGRQLYDLNYQFVKGTLSFSSKEDVYKNTYSCKADGSISEILGIKAVCYELSSSTKYGTLKFISNGRFTYTPAKGFTGNDSFVVAAMMSGSETVYYTVNIKVGD